MTRDQITYKIEKVSKNPEMKIENGENCMILIYIPGCNICERFPYIPNPDGYPNSSGMNESGEIISNLKKKYCITKLWGLLLNVFG